MSLITFNVIRFILYVVPELIREDKKLKKLHQPRLNNNQYDEF